MKRQQDRGANADDAKQDHAVHGGIDAACDGKANTGLKGKRGP